MDHLRNFLAEHPNIKQLANRLMTIIPLSSRLGNDFWEWYAFFQESETWSLDQMQEFQLRRLRDLLSELIATSQFYRDRIDPVNIKQISSLEKFREQIPALSRIEYRNNYQEILNSTWEMQKLVKSQTSGTTGSALQFYHAANDNAREWAAICHQWNRVGYIPGVSRRAEFRGLTKPGQLVETAPHYNLIRCSILDLKEEHIKYYADEIRKNRINFLHGYPSALYLLASEIIHAGIDFPQPKAILLASEMVYDWQVNQIQTAFPNAKIFAHYGCAERTVLASWCEHRQEYHILPQYGLLEIDKNTSEIIGTNLYNSVNGFVRYRMTDTVLQQDDTICPDCGRPYTPRLLELGGRSEDFLFSPEKGWIPPAIVTYPLKSLQGIRELQFYQKEKTKIAVRYTSLSTNRGLLKHDLSQIEAGLQHLFGIGVEYRFEQVDDFEKGPTGKFKWIICELEETPSKRE